MNEFSAKKLGEVLAFCEAGSAIFEKGESAMREILDTRYFETTSAFSETAKEILSIAKENKILKTVTDKAEKTKGKLLAMAEMYIGDEWDNKAELLEWFGFFEGAAIVHWKLVDGVAAAKQDESLRILANENIRVHADLLSRYGELIKEYAEGRSK